MAAHDGISSGHAPFLGEHAPNTPETPTGRRATYDAVGGGDRAHAPGVGGAGTEQTDRWLADSWPPAEWSRSELHGSEWQTGEWQTGDLPRVAADNGRSSATGSAHEATSDDDLDDVDARFLSHLGESSLDLDGRGTDDTRVLDLNASTVGAAGATAAGSATGTAASAEAPTTSNARHAASDAPTAAPSAPPPAAPPARAREPRRRPTFDIPPVPADSRSTRSESLTADTVIRRRRPRPQSGFRKGIYSLTGGKVNLGLSRADRRRAELIDRARTPVRGCHRLAVISLKGGVGKTTTTAALGAVFAELRGDRVVALDANPDRGTLIERVPRESGATVRHLLAHRDDVQRYADVRAFTSQSPTRLEVLASDTDPHVSAAFSEDDYRDAVDVLERFYNLVLTDCGTGLLHDAMHGVLGLASSLVVVSSASLDGARSASATLDWLEAHHFEHLAKNAVVVISSVRPGGGLVDVEQLEEHFLSRCRDVVTIPYDPHLEAGGVLDLGELDEETMDAYRELAASVGQGFAAVTAH